MACRCQGGDVVTESEAYRAGYQWGKDEAAWVTDPNTTPDTARWILQGLDDGDPEVYDAYSRSPLSGEWAGESIPELSDTFGLDLADDDVATEFEAGFSAGWEHQLRLDCVRIAGQS